MLKGIIFDMDGVLINSEPLHYRAWREAVKSRGIEALDYDVYKPCIGSTNGFLMDILHDNYGIDKNDMSLVQEMKEIKEKIVAKEGFPLIEGVPELLEGLKESGLRLAIASSSPLKYIRQVVETLGLDKYFEIFMSGEQVENPKPAPDVFLKTAEKMGLSPDECIVIEDSGNGCKAAKSAGIVCVAYYNPDSGQQDLSPAQMIVEGYEEIDRAFLEKVYCHGNHLPAVVCETKRLLIREISEEDIPRMMEITRQGNALTSEDVPKTLEEEKKDFPTYRKYMYEMCDMGYWALVEKHTGKIIGRAGVEPKIWNDRNSVVELGYLIEEKSRRKGYAYEACQGILNEVKNRGAVYLYCRIHKKNHPSINLAKKLGFHKIDFHPEGQGKDVDVYRYTCSQ